jgi:hypothetical protein
MPAGAPVEYRLAYLRARLSGSAAALAVRRSAVEALAIGTPDEQPIDATAAGRVLDAAADELGWSADPDPWPAVLAAAGLGGDRVGGVAWTAANLGAVLTAAADGANRSAGPFRAAVRERLAAARDELGCSVAERQAEEAQLAAELLANRERATAVRAYADDGLVQRVARAEGHLSRELDRVLALLARCRAGREGEPPAVRTIGLVVSDRGAREPLRLPIGATG